MIQQKPIFKNKEIVVEFPREEVLLDNISTVVIPRAYVLENQDFWDNVVFKFFEIYYYSKDGVSIREQARMIEALIGNIFDFQPSVIKPKDILKLD